jgi:hypothetical protein
MDDPVLQSLSREKAQKGQPDGGPQRAGERADAPAQQRSQAAELE